MAGIRKRMERNLNQKEVEQLLGQIEVRPSSNWQASMLAKIRALDGESPSHTFNFLTFFTMKKLIPVALALGVVMIAVFSFGNFNPYANALGHLQNAEKALSELESYSKGGSLTPVTSFLVETAYALDEDAQAIGLVKKVEKETKSALDDTDKIKNEDKKDEVLEKVDAAQEKTVTVLSNVIASANSETLTAVAEAVVEKTAEDNEKVEEVCKKIREKKAERTKARLEQAEKTFSSLGMKVEDMSRPMQEKYEAVKTMIETCKKEGEVCRSGKLHGLSTALNAKVRNTLRHQEKREVKKEKAQNAEDKDEDKNEDKTKDDQDKNPQEKVEKVKETKKVKE